MPLCMVGDGSYRLVGRYDPAPDSGYGLTVGWLVNIWLSIKAPLCKGHFHGSNGVLSKRFCYIFVYIGQFNHIIGLQKMIHTSTPLGLVNILRHQLVKRLFWLHVC